MDKSDQGMGFAAAVVGVETEDKADLVASAQ
jgi:hypothetical protein